MASNNNSFLGTGWAFPPTFVQASGKTETVSALDDIKESIMLLLHTEINERVMNAEYGTDLRRLVFEPLDATLKSYFRNMIQNAILLHEPRIRPDDIILEEDVDEGMIFIQVYFTVPSVNTRSNIVYPFYKEEATNR